MTTTHAASSQAGLASFRPPHASIGFTVDTAVKDAAEQVAATLEGAMIFYSPDEAGAVVIQFNATDDGGTYVVDINENGDTRSGMVTLETGWDA